MPNNKRICNCPEPPGGRVTCDNDQLAICRIKNGRIEAECISIPSNISRLSPINNFNWILSTVTGTQRDISSFLFASDYEILKRGSYRDGGYEVRFTLPLYCQKMLDNLI